MERHTIIGSTSDLVLSAEERRQHIGIFGATGVGKSTLLRSIAAQDILRGDGLLLIDPHGTLAEDVIRHIPRARANHVAYLNPADLDFPIALNVLEDVHPDLRAAAVDALVSAMRGIWHDSWGPRLEIILRHAAMALIETPGASLAMLPRFLSDDAYRLRVTRRMRDPIARAFFGQRFNNWRDTFREEAIDPVLNKVEAFLSFPAIRNILGQSRSTLHFDHALCRSRIIIANLGKGLVGDSAAWLFGALLLARVQAAAMVRAGSPRRDFHVIVDEAQNFGTHTIATLLSEARKFGISLTLATQYLAGLSEATRTALLGNVGTLVVYRVGSEDAAALAPQFDRMHSGFNPQALRELARSEAYARSPSRDTARVAVPQLPVPEGVPDLIKRQSRRHFGVSRPDVEKKLHRALGLREKIR